MPGAAHSLGLGRQERAAVVSRVLQCPLPMPDQAPSTTKNTASALRGDASASAPSSPPRTPLSFALLVLRFVLPVVAVGYMLRIIPIAEVIASAKRVPITAIVAACAIIVIATAVATYRWQLLFGACGVKAKPRFLDLFRIYWICIFYNTYVPGGLGGEVVRAIATRRIVGPGGIAMSGAIVLLERTLGLTGMLILVVVGFTLFPLKGVPHVMLFSAAGIGAACIAVFVIVRGARLAKFLPAPIARIAASLPTIESWPLFVVALLLSVVTQSSGVVVGHILISSITAKALWTDSVVMLPLILASQYFPLTIAGAGVRELGFVMFYGTVGVSKPDALAASFMLMGIQFLMNATGGVLHAIRPITLEEPAGEGAAADAPAPFERAS